MVHLHSAGQMPGPNRMACGHRKWARASWAPYSIEGWPGAGVNRVALRLPGRDRGIRYAGHRLPLGPVLDLGLEVPDTRIPDTTWECPQ